MRGLPGLAATASYVVVCQQELRAALSREAGLDKSQLLKGVLDLAVLAVVQEQDGYGYDVVRRLRAAGFDEVGDASVYGTLRRLYQAGALSSYVVPSDEGPHRKYYAINETGRSMFEESAKTWRNLADAIDRVLDSSQEAA